MKLCRFQAGDGSSRIGLVDENETILDLAPLGIRSLEQLIESKDEVATLLRSLDRSRRDRFRLSEVRLQTPVERQEIWAAGVTYLRSKTARMEESDFSASAYDRVYAADRPELFFKSLPEKVVPPGHPVGIRQDARWNVPEPELALVINSRGVIRGYTIGNDMSSRDLEGENALYLPQAKIYKHSCAVGPWLQLGPPENEARTWGISLEIFRGTERCFAGETSVGQIKRSFEELAGYLYRSQDFPRGTILLTGTGIVPPDDFTLRPGDRINIGISGIGSLENSVVEV